MTGVGGITARSIATALRSCGSFDSYELIGTDCNRLSIGLYQKHLFNKAYIVPKATDPNYWAVIEKIIYDNDIEQAIVQPEQEVLEWSRRAKGQELPCKALIPDFNIASILIDKLLMTETLKPFGLVPRSLSIDANQNSFDEVETELSYPFWIRSTLGSSGFGSLKVESRQMLKSWIAINPEIGKFLASEYLPGRNLACKMLYFNGELIRSACAERVNYIMSNIAPSGITGNTSFGRLLNAPEVFKTAKEGLEILFGKTSSSKHGFFTVDLKENENGKPLITEVNIRHIAFTSCFATAGANFAEDTVRLLADDKDFDKKFRLYEFREGLIFVRDIDCLPIVMRDSDLF